LQFLTAGDAQGTLIILRVLLEETVDDYDSEQDYDGEVASFIQSLGMPLAETILSLELDEQERKALQKSLQEVYSDLDETIEDSELDVIFAALEYGWNEIPEDNLNLADDTDDDADQEKEEEDDDDDDADEIWFPRDELEQARLNVLERQNRVEEFLSLAEKVDTHRYVLKLLQLGRLQTAITASQDLNSDDAILDVAQKLHATGQAQTALSLAERGLTLKGYRHYELAAWLAPLEEAAGRKDLALLAYRAAYDVRPAINFYRHIKRLSGKNWETIQPELLQKVNEARDPSTMAEIHLEEQQWDAAILLAEKNSWSDLVEKVAETVIPVRPDWVINFSLKQANDLIAPTQSKLYPGAAKWLARAKKAYLHKGQSAEWQAYLNHLRQTYARRPSLQKELARL